MIWIKILYDLYDLVFFCMFYMFGVIGVICMIFVTRSICMICTIWSFALVAGLRSTVHFHVDGQYSVAAYIMELSTTTSCILFHVPGMCV